MRILIVGSSGFVGQNFLDYLFNKREIEIHTLDRVQNEQDGLIAHTWDEFQNLDLATIAKVFYFTGKAHDIKKNTSDQEYFDVNVGLLKIFLQRAQQSDFSGQIVYLSSVKAVADSVEGILTEEQIPLPKTSYGKSKLAAEELLKSSVFASQTFILRPCMIHGKGNKGNLNQLFGFVKKGIPNLLAAYTNERSLLSIDNLVHVFDEIIHNRLPIDTYHVADEGYISTHEIMDVIGNTIGKKVFHIKLPPFLVLALAKVGDYLPLPLNSERLQKLTENYRVSNDKLQKKMTTMLPLPLKKGLKNTIQTFE